MARQGCCRAGQICPVLGASVSGYRAWMHHGTPDRVRARIARDRIAKKQYIATMQYVKAQQITRRKETRADGSIIEVVIWQLPESVPPCDHRYKYRLAYVVDGVCVVRYDNEHGKGDHRHLGGKETAYCFVSLERLLADFRSDVEEWK